MKKALLIIALLGMIVHETTAVNKDGFTLSVIFDSRPVKEMVEDNKRRAAIPFGSEYKLRLKNTYGRRCSVKIMIDGCAVSMLGDVIVNANNEIDLERFLDASLTEGNKFKFVRLDDPAVDDPTKEENGLIEATFTLEKKTDVEIIPNWYWYSQPFTNWYWYSKSVINCSASYSANTEPGATVQGSESYQNFQKVSFVGTSENTTLRLWLRGIVRD